MEADGEPAGQERHVSTGKKITKTEGRNNPKTLRAHAGEVKNAE